MDLIQIPITENDYLPAWTSFSIVLTNYLFA
jgi:hypothetical protein